MKTSQCRPCGKPLYPVRLQAIGAALHASGRCGKALRVYRCPHGGGFHLTSQPRRGEGHAA